MQRVVVTGMGVVAPDGMGVKEFWPSLVNGVKKERQIKSFEPPLTNEIQISFTPIPFGATTPIPVTTTLCIALLFGHKKKPSYDFLRLKDRRCFQGTIKAIFVPGNNDRKYQIV